MSLDSNEKIMHVVCFDIPYPPNYGGIVDVYYKLRTLNKMGISIILHCFYKEEKDINRLKELCKEVHLYKRRKTNLFNFLPFIVSSRMSSKLNHRLREDKHPILIEGIHCTGFLLRNVKKDRRIGLRTHNIEQDYYRNLGKISGNPLKKLYYYSESLRLKYYEKRISRKVDFVFPISHADLLHIKEVFQKSTIAYTSAFYNDRIEVCAPKNYVLMQGNFQVDENQEALEFMLKEVIPYCKSENFVIAGKNASDYVKNAPSNVKVVSSPNKMQMYALNDEAKASVVYSNLNAGVKLKILNSLSAGVPVYCNQGLVLDPYLKMNVVQYKNNQELIKLIANSDRSTKSREERQKNFKSVFNLDHFGNQIVNCLFS